MTEYTAEEVRAVAKRLHDDITVMDSDALAASGMLIAYAERLAADEVAADYPECSGDPSSCPENEGHGCCKPNPPAQAAQMAQGEAVAKVRHFDYRGIARNDFSQEAQMLDGAPVLPDGTLLYTTPPAQPAERAIGELLAVIHGDGGHYLARHGVEKAATDALPKVYALMQKAAQQADR